MAGSTAAAPSGQATRGDHHARIMTPLADRAGELGAERRPPGTSVTKGAAKNVNVGDLIPVSTHTPQFPTLWALIGPRCGSAYGQLENRTKDHARGLP